MFYRHLITSLFAGVALIAANGAAQACAGPCGSPCTTCETPCATPCAPAYRTITVSEWVPETYQTTRTVYKTEYVNEAYTAYKTVCVPETRTYARTISKMVPEVRDVVCTEYKCVPEVVTKTIMKKVKVCKEVTTDHHKWVDKGHYECCQVPYTPLFAKKCSSCCDSCCEPCVKYKTKKVWVPCKVCIETPCTKTVVSWECVPECVTCTVNKMIPIQVTKKVCCNRCVTEVVNETCTVNVSKCVPYQATRCVAKCVPVVENVTACRMVCRTVEKQVPDCDTCATPCCTTKARWFKSCCH
jgi:hypothetical protein